MKLKTKIILSSVSIYLIILGSLTFILQNERKTELLKELHSNIEHKSLLLSQVNASPLYDINTDSLETNMKSFLNTKGIELITLSEITGDIKLNVGNNNIDKASFLMNKKDIIFQDEIIGTNTIYYNDKYIYQKLQDNLKRIFEYLLFASILISIALYFLLKGFLKPISTLTQIASKITSGDLDQKIKIKSDDEISELSNQFESMRISLKERIDTINSQNQEIQNFNKNLELEIKERTEELLEQKNTFETLVNAIPDIVWMKDKEGIYLHCNDRFSEFFNDKKENIIGKTDYDYVNEELADFFRKHDKNAMNANTPLINYEIIPFANDGHEEYTQTMKTAVRDDNGEILGVLGIGRDFTNEQERKEELEQINDELESTIDNLKVTQTKLIEAEKMSSLGVLVAGIAHEVNTPVGIGLTGATHFLEITDKLKKDYETEEMSQDDFEGYLNTSKEIAELINTNLERTAQLVKNFKQISFDQSSEEKREFNLKVYIEEILFSINNITKKTNLTINMNCEEDIEICSYPGALSQIITNLIINSIRHGFEEKEKGNISIEASRQEHIIKLVYKDDGKGIKEENLAKVFDPFFTTNREAGGTGLGLNILYNIITTSLNGTIACNSKENEGVEFIILFQEDTNDSRIEKEELWQI